MNWTEILEAIKAWAAEATGLEEGMVILEDEERPFLDALYCLIVMGPVTRIGMDWTGEVYDEATEKLIPVRRGVREFVTTLAFESDSQRPGLFALHYGELLRTRGGLEEIVARTKAVNLALVDVGDAQVANYERDQRMVSRAEVPIRWRTVSVVVEEALARDTIATAPVPPGTITR